jgi:hypothetical protein
VDPLNLSSVQRCDELIGQKVPNDFNITEHLRAGQLRDRDEGYSLAVASVLIGKLVH